MTIPELLSWARSFASANGRDRLHAVAGIVRNNSAVRFALVRCDDDDCDQAIVSSSLVHKDERTCENCDKCSECCSCQTCNRYGCNRVEKELCENCEKCSECCECRTCSRARCGARVDTTCSSCNICESCGCDCRFCDHCGNECNDDYCGECYSCESCCSCSSGDSKVEMFESPLTFHAAARNERKRNTSSRFISVEIEVANCDSDNRISDTVRRWKGSIVEDGSLPDTGFEINTAPASGDKFVKQIEEICGALSYDAATINTLCGLHVHLDARDFDFYAIRRLIQVYARIEPALFDMASNSRRESHYCKPCGTEYLRAIEGGVMPYKLLKSKIHGVVYPNADTRRLKSLKRDKWGGERYNALNLHSWFYRGTVECRIFNGTVMSEKIVPWGMLWARILDYAWSSSDESIKSELTGDAHECLQKIASAIPLLVTFVDERIAKHGR